MTTLTEIIKRLNQRIEASNIFDRIFGLCEPNPSGKGFMHYDGNGQGKLVTDYDAKRGTIFWIKRGDVTTSEDTTLKISGCKKMYRTAFPLTAYCVVLKSHLPCDNSESEDWIGGQVNRFLAGMDNGFKQSLGVASYEVVPSKYSVTTKDLPENLEWAALTVDFIVNITTDSAANCYDLCTSEPIPLPPAFEPCQPCLTKVYTSGDNISGDGTQNNPLEVTGGGGGGSIRIQNEGVTVTNAATNIDFIGNIVTASLAGAGDVDVTINQVQSDWNASTGLGQILNKPTIVSPVNADWNASSGLAQILNKPTIPTATSDLTNDGADGVNPFITAADVPAQVNSDWNAVSGVAEILNKPTIPAAQVNSDWNATSGVAEILNKPTIPSTLPPSGTAGGDLSGTYPDPTVHGIHGIDMQNGTPSADDVWVYGGSPAKWQHQKLHASQVTNDSGVTGVNVDDALDTLDSTKTTYSQVATQITAALVGYATQLWVNSQGFITNVITSLGYTPENVANKQTNLSASATKYPTVNAVNSGLANKQDLLGFTPENVANKSTSVSADQASDVKYPSVKAVFDWASSVFTTTSAVASQITTALTGYATQAWVTSQGYLTAITSLQVTTALGFTPVTNARTITINGTTQDLSANRTWTLSTPTIYKVTADTAGYSSAANTAVFTQSIPANTFAIGDIIRLSWRTRKTGTGGAQTLRIYVNATADLSGSPILCGVAGIATSTNLMNQMQRHFAIKSSTNNTEVYATSGSAATDFGQFAAVTTAAIDWTANRFIVFAIQNSNAVDVNFGSFYLIEKL